MSTPFQTPHLFARKIALNPLRSTSNDGPTKPVLKTKKMQKCRNYIFCFHIFTQVHTTNPAHATRGRGHLVAALSFFVTSIHFSYDQPSSCYPRPRPLHYRTRWLDLQHTHARTCHLKPRRVHHAPAPESTTTYPLVLSGTCTFLYLSSSVTHSHCFKTLSSTTTLEIAGRRTCPFRQDKSSGLISRAESQKIAV